MFFRRFLRQSDGATGIEYGMLAGLIGVGIVVGVSNMGGVSSNTFNTITTGINPLHEFQEEILIQSANVYDAVAGDNGGCNGYGSCGHLGNYAAFMGLFNYASASGQELPTDKASLDVLRNKVKAHLSSQGLNANLAGSFMIDFGDPVPEQYSAEYQELETAVEAYFAQCDDCFP